MRRTFPLVVGLALLILPAVAGAQGLQNVQDAAGKAKKGERFPVTTLFFLQHRQLAVVDEDPANNQLTVYALRAQGRLTRDLSVFMTGGLVQRYVAEQGESPFRLIDSRLGVAWRTPVSLSGTQKLGILNEFSVFLPTSRNSQLQDMTAAPQARVQFMLQPIKGMTLALSPRFRYRFHRFAERAGQQAVMNIRIDTGVRGGIDYGLLNFGKAGRIGIGASAGTTYVRKYDSREAYASENSDQGVWLQVYDWEAHLTYSILMLNFALSIEQGGNVLRNGVVNTFFAHRDETELVFSAFAMF
jgi:hypothetical protein